jgi:hypothetical protein
MISLQPVRKWPPAERWFNAWLIFDPEDGGDTFFRNVG